MCVYHSVTKLINILTTTFENTREGQCPLHLRKGKHLYKLGLVLRLPMILY